MNAFQRDAAAIRQARTVEEMARQEILPWLQLKCESVDECDNLWLQKVVGDFVIVQEGKKRGVELKAETKFTGNLFLETWSNRPELTFGWLWTSRARWLFYYFTDNRNLYIIDLPALQQWAVKGEIYQYAEKPQGKYDQLNYTWGRIVPIDAIQRAGVPWKLFRAEDRKA